MGLSSCLILFGGGLIYTITGLTNFEAIYIFISVSETNKIIQGLNLGFIFIIVGLLFKIASAPLHNWQNWRNSGVKFSYLLTNLRILLYAKILLFLQKSVISEKFYVLKYNLQEKLTLFIINNVNNLEVLSKTDKEELSLLFKNQLNFIYWFIGFCEGDVSFVLNLRDGPIFTIHLNIADLKILELIKDTLKFGNIYINKNGTSCSFTVSKRTDILKLITIFNGRLFLKKRQG
jgi:hypothetical protein